MKGAPGWLSFRGAIALVLAQRRECHTDREIGSWLVDLAARGVVRTVSGQHDIDEALDHYRLGHKEWWLSLAYSEARWSGTDIKVALASENAEPKRGVGRPKLDLSSYIETAARMLSTGRAEGDVQSHIIGRMIDAEGLIYGTAYSRVHDNVMPRAKDIMAKTST